MAAHDPDADEGVSDAETAVRGADVVVLATNHAEYGGIETVINEFANPKGPSTTSGVSSTVTN